MCAIAPEEVLAVGEQLRIAITIQISQLRRRTPAPIISEDEGEGIAGKGKDPRPHAALDRIVHRVPKSDHGTAVLTHPSGRVRCIQPDSFGADQQPQSIHAFVQQKELPDTAEAVPLRILREAERRR